MRTKLTAGFSMGALALAPMWLHGCGGGSSSGGSSAKMDLEQVSNGFGQILPHTIFRLGADGQATNQLLAIRTEEDLLANLTSTNRVQPVVQFETTATLPTGAPGNQFFYAEFNQDVDIDSVLDPSPAAQSNNGLTGTVTLVALDSATGDSSIVPARVLINGFTYAGTATGSPPSLPLQQWVSLDANTGVVNVLPVGASTPGLGFPGTQGTFPGYEKLISPRTIVLIADSDGDLATYETFPANRQLRLRVSTGVKSTSGQFQRRQALAGTTVGPDTLNPEVLVTPPPISTPVVVPGGGAQNIDPMTSVRIEFTEPVQLLTVGSLPNGTAPTLSASVRLEFGPSSARVRVPFTAFPVSVFDLATYELTPTFNFPGEGPDQFECGVFNRVDITINAAQVEDLALIPNKNQLVANTFFVTGEGPGLINAPVTPDTVYIGRSGAVPGLSVIDLNGMGQSTGDPTFDPTYTTFAEGRSNFPNNPNVRLQGALLRPALTPGTCTVNGGSSGVFTLTRDSSLNNLLVRAPILTNVSDMMLGHGLDSAFNNGPAPFGCQAGGGNLCAFDGKKLVAPVIVGTGNVEGPTQPGQFGGLSPGAENLMGWAPHPNPPPLVFPPLCISPYIGGQEPTSIDTPVTNLLAPGDAFGLPLVGIPPQGLLTPEQNGYFLGPSIEQPTIGACSAYMVRQQIGQYLYVIDRGRAEVIVFNSNRMTVIDRIQTFDPTSLAMSPNLNFMAIVNQLSNLVSFLDIDPSSSTFHQVVKETVVGNRPRGIAWDPGNEDILVANEVENTVSVISAGSLTVRKVVSSQLNQPFEISITPRQPCFGFSRNVYFAYILNRNGRIAIFESGPNTVNGWGYDDVIGISTETFLNPKAMQVDPIDLRSGVWIAHEGPIDLQTGQAGSVGVGAVSKFVCISGIAGQLPLNFTSLTVPQLRDLAYGVPISIGIDQLSGLPVDLAFDNFRVLSGQPNFVTTSSVGSPAQLNGKQLVRGSCPTPVNTTEPKYMFVAVPNSVNGSGVVDVILVDGTFGRTDTNPFVAGTQSIPAPNVQVVMDYFRQ